VLHSIRLFAVRGIALRLHWSFATVVAILPLYYLLKEGLAAALLGIAIVCILLALAALHETARVLTAVRLGAVRREIILMPVGGAPIPGRGLEEPGKDSAVAAVGPLLNVLIAAMLYAFMAWLPGVVFDPADLRNNDTPLTWALVALFQTNVALAIFSLVPAFPMDGGRLLRALLVKTGMPYARATTATAWTGRVILVAMTAAGILTLKPLLVLLPLLLVSAAGEEEAAARAATATKGLLVRHLLPQKPICISQVLRLGDLIPLMLATSQRHFPVTRRGRILGVVSVDDLRREIPKPGGADRSVMAALRPPLEVGPDEPLDDVRRKLENARAPAACVMHRGRLMGLVSQDTLRSLSAILEPGGE